MATTKWGRPNQANVLAYAQYLTVAASCGECHTQKVQGKPVTGMEMVGGVEFPMPHGILRSPNLTPDPETGIGNWSATAFVQRFNSASQPRRNGVFIGEEGGITTIR